MDIRYVGIVEENEINQMYTGVNLPQGAKEINGMDVQNPFWQTLMAFPIMVIFTGLMVWKIRRFHKNKNRSNVIKNKKFYEKMGQIDGLFKKTLYTHWYFIRNILRMILVVVISLPIYRLVQTLFMWGHTTYIGLNQQNFLTFAFTLDGMGRTQQLFVILAPIVLLGIIPFILITYLYPKRIKHRHTYIVLVFATICFIGIAAPDLIMAQNILSEVPKGTTIIQTQDNAYWYREES